MATWNTACGVVIISDRVDLENLFTSFLPCRGGDSIGGANIVAGYNPEPPGVMILCWWAPGRSKSRFGLWEDCGLTSWNAWNPDRKLGAGLSDVTGFWNPTFSFKRKEKNKNYIKKIYTIIYALFLYNDNFWISELTCRLFWNKTAKGEYSEKNKMLKSVRRRPYWWDSF